jgi:CubicO group peptidase (beta-lactamase class C family)
MSDAGDDVQGSAICNAAAAARLGFDRQRLDQFAQSIRKDVARRVFDGARVLVARRGEVAFDGVFGFADRAAGRPLKHDDVFAVMSLVKSWTTVAALRLVERGDMALNTRIADVIPGFEVNGKQRITLAHVLTHTAGLPLGWPPIPPERRGDLDANMKAICAMAPLTTPGEVVSYSAAIGYAILGDLVRRCDPKARSYRKIMHEDLIDPLRMTDTAIGSRADLEPRRVPVVVTDTAPNVFGVDILLQMNQLLNEASEIPGSGGISTGHDMLRFAEMLRRGGELDGARILSPAMVRFATTIHTGSRPNSLYVLMREEELFDASPANLGLGFTVRGEGMHLTPFGMLASPRTFGALGIGSTVYWVDPERELAVVALTAGLLGQFNNYTRFQKWSDAIISSLVDA